MVTFVLIYIFFYIFVMLNLLILSFLYLPFTFLTQLSVTAYLTIVQKYTNMRGLFFFSIFSLTGLPPVGLFFVKFNIFIFILYQTHFILVIVLFLVFLLNMFYYIQLFNIKNYKKSVYSTIKPLILSNWSETYSISNLFSSYNKFYLTIFITTVSGLVIFNLCFYSDLYLILHL